MPALYWGTHERNIKPVFEFNFWIRSSFWQHKLSEEQHKTSITCFSLFYDNKWHIFPHSTFSNVKIPGYLFDLCVNKPNIILSRTKATHSLAVLSHFMYLVRARRWIKWIKMSWNTSWFSWGMFVWPNLLKFTFFLWLLPFLHFHLRSTIFSHMCC